MPDSQPNTAVVLLGLFRDLLAEHHPDVISVMDDGAEYASLSEPDLLRCLQAQGICFQLLNLADQRETMKKRQRVAAQRGAEQVRGTFFNVLAQASKAGLSEPRLQELLNASEVSAVITAHPTEAKRVTILQIHRRIYLLLLERDRLRISGAEDALLTRSLRAEIELLWLTGDLFIEKPTVDREIGWGLHFFNEALFDAVPNVYARLEQAVKQYYPGTEIQIPSMLGYCSWIGGDRDGNPNVSNPVTRTAIERHRITAIDRYHSQIAILIEKLSLADHSVAFPQQFHERLTLLLQQSGRKEEIQRRNKGELFRQFLVCVSEKLQNTGKPAGSSVVLENSSTKSSDGYAHANALLNDLQLVQQTLISVGCSAVADDLVKPLVRQVSVFGFRTAGLDLRENSSTINAALAELWQLLDPTISTVPDSLSEEWKDWILEQLGQPGSGISIDESQLTESTRSTLGMLGVVQQVQSDSNQGPLSKFILSMTRSATDILGVYLLAKYAGAFTDHEAVESCRILVVPLLETIDDLRAGPAILKELLAVPMVRRTIRSLGGVQEIMVGYSDSNKDGGYFCATWEVNKAQARIHKVGLRHNTRISFFHGRGGSMSRGGAPTGRAIAAQPAGTVQGRMRVTEQGEVVSSKYANRGVAEYHLEMLLSGVLEHSLKSEAESELKPHADYDEAMEALSGIAYLHYRKLAEMPGLLEFYQSASPVDELVLLKLGSRPARRFGAETLHDLRAIPWVFGWTQNRMMIPGWYGVGTALQRFIEIRGQFGTDMLEEMFEHSRLFRLIIDEVEKTLKLVNIDIARKYSELAPNQSEREAIFDLICAEYELTSRLILAVTGETTLCERFKRYRKRLSERLPIIDSVGPQQIALIKQFRGDKPVTGNAGKKQTLIPLLLSINCIAAGIGWTG